MGLWPENCLPLFTIFTSMDSISNLSLPVTCYHCIFLNQIHTFPLLEKIKNPCSIGIKKGGTRLRVIFLSQLDRRF